MEIERRQPMISIVMPCLNEERCIVRAISSLLEDAGDGVELLVIDGGSTDRTRDIVRAISGSGAPVRLLDNPKGRVSAAMNIGIHEARGEYIVRADAHGVYPPGYARRCVELLEETGAANAGGMQVPVAEISNLAVNKIVPCIDPGVQDKAGTGHEATGGKAKRAQEPAGVKKSTENDNVSKAVSLAMRHPLGVGDARWRLGRRSGFVDTVYLGAFRRSLFDEIGFYDEAADANQDAELNMRILAAGKTIYLDHTLEVLYFPRESLCRLARQYFRYGRGRARTALKHRRLTSWRQAAAPVLFIGLGGSMIAALWKPVFFAIPATYAAGLVAVALFSRFPDPTRKSNLVLKSGDGNGVGLSDESGVRNEIGGAKDGSGESATREEPNSKNDGESNRTGHLGMTEDKSASAGGSIGLRTRLLVAAAWAVMHMCWGAGFLGRFVFKGRCAAPANEAARRNDRGTNGK